MPSDITFLPVAGGEVFPTDVADVRPLADAVDALDSAISKRVTLMSDELGQGANTMNLS